MEDSASTKRLGILAGSSLRKTTARGITGNSIYSPVEEWDEVEEKKLVP